MCGPSVASTPDSAADVAKEAIALVVEDRRVVLREVGFHQVDPAVAVVDRRRRRPCPPARGRRRHGEPGEHALFRERAVAAVPEEQVRHRVVRHEDVGPAVIVEIREQHAEAVVARVDDARRARHVGEVAVPGVAIQHVGLAHQGPRTAERRRCSGSGRRPTRARAAPCAHRTGHSSRRTGRAGRRGRSRRRRSRCSIAGPPLRPVPW